MLYHRYFSHELPKGDFEMTLPQSTHEDHDDPKLLPGSKLEPHNPENWKNQDVHI